jgi:ribosomal protein S18 acetylase RimI-like enzyme
VTLSDGEVHLRNASGAEVDRLQPLWLLLHHHHQELLPHEAPYVDDDTSWAARRSLYVELLAKPETVLIVAVVGDDVAIGYGLAHVMEVGETWVADTWKTALRIGEIESLGVVPEWRGRGIGSRLLNALMSRLADIGVEDLVLGVVPGNRSITLYERFGFRTTWTYMSRFTHRSVES